MVGQFYLTYCANDEVLDGRKMPDFENWLEVLVRDAEPIRDFHHWQGGDGYGSLIHLSMRGYGRLKDWDTAVEAVRWAAQRGGDWPSRDQLVQAFDLLDELIAGIEEVADA